jgi:hypothetical protein
MTRVRCFLCVMAAVVTSGCLSSTTLVRVQPDGSGTIEQVLLVNAQTAKMMLGGLGIQDPSAPAPAVNEANLQRAAERMGPGVRLLSAEPARQGTFEGSRAVFAFNDITTLRLDPDAAMAGATSGMAERSASSPVTFQFTRAGGTSRLTVAFDEDAVEMTPQEGEETAVPPGMFSDPQVLQMMRAMFAGLRMSIDIEVDGTIVRTNADHVSGSRITLLDLDLDALTADEAVLKDLQDRMGPNLSVAQLRPFLKNVRGLKINDPVVTIEFR